MRVPLLLGLCVVLIAPLAWAEEGRGDAPLDDLERRLGALRERMSSLLKEAQKDVREGKIDQYLAYNPDQMKNARKRAVRAEDLARWMANKDDSPVRFNLQVKAMEALVRGWQVLQDPELSRDERRGGQSNLARFCVKHVVPLLADKNEKVRGLAKDLLNTYWGRVATEADIFNYKVRGSSRNHKAAIRAWKSHLKRK